MQNKDNIDHNNKQIFYGLSLPPDINREEEIKVVFDNRTEAFEALKRLKGSRFKPFDNLNDAILFSQSVVTNKEVDSCDQNQSNKNIEKMLSPFSGLHPRELSKLRKAIESGHYSTVEQLIRSNPRYLVGSGDTPSILMEGPRYNACHIAVKANRHEIIRLILSTISDKLFWKLLFPFDANEITESRINFSLDLYLNTPCSEKALCDTPLHLGCKWGSLESVAILLSYSKCDTEKPNKLGKKPSEVVCERKGDKSLKIEIFKLFEAQLYIPLIRSDLVCAQIGKPVKGTIQTNDLNGKVAAVAGPMSPQQAEKLYKTLKSPLKCTPNDRKIRLTDSQKGLERVCRNLCKDMAINWEEFWPFLNTRIDLTSDEGLDRLETHLRHIYYDLDRNSSKEQNLLDLEDLENESHRLTTQMSSLNLNLNSRDVSLIEDNQIELFNEYIDCGQTSNLDESSNDSFASANYCLTFLYDFYINGSNILREDIDAALALQNIIDSDRCLKYEFIQNWFKRVRAKRPQHFDGFESFDSPLAFTPN